MDTEERRLDPERRSEAGPSAGRGPCGAPDPLEPDGSGESGEGAAGVAAWPDDGSDG